MSRGSCYLLSLIEDNISKQDTNFCKAISPAKRLAIALHYYQDHEGRMRVTSKFFGVGKPSVPSTLIDFATLQLKITVRSGGSSISVSFFSKVVKKFKR